jgi:DNA-binding beta-propeller fold protein YncE
LKTLGAVKTDGNPDAIAYDAVSKRVFTFNGHGKNTTAINGAAGSVAGTLARGGKPEFAAAQGSIFVNNEDTSELIQIDTQKISETRRWPLAPGKSPSGLAMDLKTRLRFSVCDEKVMDVSDAFDPATNYAFGSCGYGKSHRHSRRLAGQIHCRGKGSHRSGVPAPWVST